MSSADQAEVPASGNERRIRLGSIIWIVVAAALCALPLSFGAFWLNMVIMALIVSLAVFSINLLSGLTGLLSFGQAGFVGIGAYTLGILSKQGVAPLAAGACGVGLAMASGFLLGLPAARLKGHYLAIGTLGFGILILQLLTNWVDLTRGPMGLIGIPTGGVDKTTWYLIMLAVCLAVLAALTYIDRYSALGVVMKMVRHDEIAAQASGVNIFAVKLVAFTASAGLAGLAGALLAAYVRFLTPDLFSEQESFRYLMMAVVGGIGSPLGGIIASLLLTMIPEGLHALGEGNLRLLVYGTMVLFVLWFLPTGIGGLVDRLRR
jgi:branched-chain amino acid transport system permease protein